MIIISTIFYNCPSLDPIFLPIIYSINFLGYIFILHFRQKSKNLMHVEFNFANAGIQYAVHSNTLTNYHNIYYWSCRILCVGDS